MVLGRELAFISRKPPLLGRKLIGREMSAFRLKMTSQAKDCFVFR